MKPTKACPVVTQEVNGELSVLAFHHPLAGCQLVKGTIQNESPAEAAIRELLEESGVMATVKEDLGTWQSDYEDEVWSFHLCASHQPLAETWVHHCADDGGHDFNFFWQSLCVEPSTQWHPVHVRALAYVRSVLTTAQNVTRQNSAS